MSAFSRGLPLGFCPPAAAGMALANCGEVESEFERLGLRSSSDRERLIGKVIGTGRCVVELLRGVAGTGLFDPIDDSDDHAGTGGRVRLGDIASFFEGCGFCWP